MDARSNKKQSLPELNNISRMSTNNNCIWLIFGINAKDKMQDIKKAIDEAIKERLAADLEQQKLTLNSLESENEIESVSRYIYLKQQKLKKDTSFTEIYGTQILVSNSIIQRRYFHSSLKDETWFCPPRKALTPCVYGKALVEVLAEKFESTILEKASLDLKRGIPLEQEVFMRIYEFRSHLFHDGKTEFPYLAEAAQQSANFKNN